MFVLINDLETLSSLKNDMQTFFTRNFIQNVQTQLHNVIFKLV